MVICVCTGVSDRQVRAVIRNGAKSLEKIAEHLDGTGQDCGCCLVALARLLDDGTRESHIRCATERPAEP